MKSINCLGPIGLARKILRHFAQPLLVFIQGQKVRNLAQILEPTVAFEAPWFQKEATLNWTSTCKRYADRL